MFAVALSLNKKGSRKMWLAMVFITGATTPEEAIEKATETALENSAKGTVVLSTIASLVPQEK